MALDANCDVVSLERAFVSAGACLLTLSSQSPPLLDMSHLGLCSALKSSHKRCIHVLVKVRKWFYNFSVNPVHGRRNAAPIAGIPSQGIGIYDLLAHVNPGRG
jgi:hypothetical protein